MPRYYCDYCDTYLTHDSPSVRKQHNAGYKHKANVRQYYQQFEEQQTQSLIDQKVKEHLGQTAAYQHLAALGQYRPPMAGLPRPGMPMPGGMPPNPMQGMMQGMRPPGLQPPPAGYNAPPGVVTYRPPVAAIPTSGAAAPQPMRPPTLTPPGAPIARPAGPTSSTMSNGPSSVSPGAYQPLMGSYNYSSQTGSTNGYAQPPNAPGSNPGAYGTRPPNSSPPAVSAPPGQNSYSYNQTSAVSSGMGQLSPPMGSPPASFRA